MQTRAARSLRTDLLDLGLPTRVAEELYLAATGRPTRRRARATAEVTERCIKRLCSGELDADAIYRRVWGIGIDAYFAAQPTSSLTRPTSSLTRH